MSDWLLLALKFITDKSPTSLRPWLVSTYQWLCRWKCSALSWISDWLPRSIPQQWWSRAITTARQYDTSDIDAGFSAVCMSCLESTIATLCYTALRPRRSTSCSECRTMQLGSCFERRDDPTPSCCFADYTGCWSSIGSSTRRLCWRSRSRTPQHQPTSTATYRHATTRGTNSVV